MELKEEEEIWWWLDLRFRMLEREEEGRRSEEKGFGGAGNARKEKEKTVGRKKT